MGELADELIDSILDGYDYLDDEDGSRPPPQCRYCGRSHGLFWQEVGDKWQLFEDRPHGYIAPHRCNRGMSPKKIIDAFDDIP